jgi:DNA-binding LacI/PurR family transcriptional regulator
MISITAKRRPTISDVAAHAGVSKGAVSFALNGRPGVAEHTRERILASARTLGWSPSTRARALSRSRAFAMGLVFSRPAELLGADPFFPLVIAGIETVLAERGFALLLQVVSGERREADSYRLLAQAGRVDGVFLLDLRSADPRVDLLAELELPTVVIGTPTLPCPHPYVAIDQGLGIRQAVAHLVGLGHTRIAHVAGPPGYVHSIGRELAWRQALEEAGLAPGPLVAGDFTGPGGAAATRLLLGSADRPTAVVYANDSMAIAGAGVAVEMGLSIPDDLSITGFDDVPLAAHVTPALTTVREDVVGWGRAAAWTLLELVDGGRPSPAALPPPTLVIRSSTRPLH